MEMWATQQNEKCRNVVKQKVKRTKTSSRKKKVQKAVWWARNRDCGWMSATTGSAEGHNMLPGCQHYGTIYLQLGGDNNWSTDNKADWQEHEK